MRAPCARQPRRRPRRRPLPLLLLLVAVHGSGDPCAKILVNDDMTYMYAVNDDPANTQMKTNCYWVACPARVRTVRLPLALHTQTTGSAT